MTTLGWPGKSVHPAVNPLPASPYSANPGAANLDTATAGAANPLAAHLFSRRLSVSLLRTMLSCQRQAGALFLGPALQTISGKFLGRTSRSSRFSVPIHLWIDA
jgi:hypothetical protein